MLENFASLRLERSGREVHLVTSTPFVDSRSVVCGKRGFTQRREVAKLGRGREEAMMECLKNVRLEVLSDAGATFLAYPSRDAIQRLMGGNSVISGPSLVPLRTLRC